MSFVSSEVPSDHMCFELEYQTHEVTEKAQYPFTYLGTLCSSESDLL